MFYILKTYAYHAWKISKDVWSQSFCRKPTQNDRIFWSLSELQRQNIFFLAKTLTSDALRKFFMRRTHTFWVCKTFSKIIGTQRTSNGVYMMHSREHLVANRFSYHFRGGPENSQLLFCEENIRCNCLKKSKGRMSVGWILAIIVWKTKKKSKFFCSDKHVDIVSTLSIFKQ